MDGTKPDGSKPVSIESRLGSQVLSKLAVILLLVGAAWFLKWAFDNRWIGPSGRILIGLAAGSGLILWSERFRRNGTPAFSYALKAVGTGVLYLSLWASFQIFHLVPAPVALLGMVLVTAWNATMAITQDAQLLAAYALFGAYITPMLLATGGNHEIFLFSYLAAIAAALLALLRAKPWNLLLLGPLPITAVFVAIWAMQSFAPDLLGLTLALVTLLWAIFAAIPLLASQADSALVNVIMPVATALFGAFSVYAFLAGSRRPAIEPWAALLFAAAYLAISRVRHSAVASAIHLSLALSFITVAIPLKLTGHGITAGWLAEAVAVIWLASMPGLEARARAVLGHLATAAMLLGVGGALLGPEVFGPGRLVFFNRGFATELGALLVLGVILARAPKLVTGVRFAPDPKLLSIVAFSLFNLTLATTAYRQINIVFAPTSANDDYMHMLALGGFAFSAWLAVQGAAMLALGFWKKIALVRWTGLFLLAITLIKTVAYDMRTLSTGFRIISYLALGALLLAVSFAYQKGLLGLDHVLDQNDEVAQ